MSSGCGEFDAWVELEEGEVKVEVNYFVQPPEPDVGVDGGIEIESIMHGKTDLMGKLSNDEIDSIANEIINTLSEDY